MRQALHPHKYFKFWLALGLAYLFLIIYLSLTPDPPRVAEFEQSDKLKHLLAYSALMLYFAWLYPERRTRRLLGLGFLVMGLGLEILQGLSGIRTPELADALANAAGLALGYFLGIQSAKIF